MILDKKTFDELEALRQKMEHDMDEIREFQWKVWRKWDEEIWNILRSSERETDLMLEDSFKQNGGR